MSRGARRDRSLACMDAFLARKHGKLTCQAQAGQGCDIGQVCHSGCGQAPVPCQVEVLQAEHGRQVAHTHVCQQCVTKAVSHSQI